MAISGIVSDIMEILLNIPPPIIKRPFRLLLSEFCQAVWHELTRVTPLPGSKKNPSPLKVRPYGGIEMDIIIPFSLRKPHSGTNSSISCSPIRSPITSSSFDSPLCTSITPSLFHSRLKPTSFTNPTPLSFTSSSRTASTDFCLHRFF